MLIHVFLNSFIMLFVKLPCPYIRFLYVCANTDQNVSRQVKNKLTIYVLLRERKYCNEYTGEYFFKKIENFVLLKNLALFKINLKNNAIYKAISVWMLNYSSGLCFSNIWHFPRLI